MKFTRTTVTGGAGFIGSHVVDGLLARGAEVQVVDDLSTGDKANLSDAFARYPGRLSLLEGSIYDPRVAAEVTAFRPQAVFHLAAQINVRRSVQDPFRDAEANVLGTVQMLEAARKGGAERFIFTSTGGAIYGEQEKFPASEEHPTHPESPYGVSKRAAELYVEYYARTANMQASVLRLGNIYGPRQNPKGEAGVVSIFITRLLNRQPLRVNGDGTQTRDYVCVSDVVRAFVMTAEAEIKRPFSVFNVGRGVEVSVNDLVSELSRLAAERGFENPAIEYGPALVGEQLRSVISADCIRNEIGWEPEVGLPEGLAQTFESFQAASG